jgi:signal transduction histidine kinase
MLLSRANLRTKVTLLLLSLSLGPLLISGIVNETRAVATGKAAVRERQAQAARFAAYTINALFDDVLRDTQLLARRFPVDSLDPAVISARLAASPGLLPAVHGDDDIQVFNALHDAESRTFLALPDGRLFYAEPFHNIPQPPNLHLLRWFQQLGPNGGIALGDLIPLTQPGRPSIFCIVPLRHPGGRLAGYVGHIMARSSLETIIKQLPPEPAWYTPERLGHALGLGLLSPEGVYAAHTVAELVGRPVPAFMEGNLHPGTGEIDRDGADVLLARADVGRAGWRVTLATPRHTAFQSVYALIWLLTAVILLTFVFVLLFADHLASVLLRPIEELERGAQMIGAGALDYRIELNQHGHDELGRLAGTFNDMGESLLRTRREVDAYGRHLKVANQELDAMVYAITHDLKKSLRGIEAFATFVDEDYRDRLDQEGTDMLHSIVHNVHKIEKLADDLIGLVQHERERGENVRFSLMELLREAREHCTLAHVGEVVIQPGMPEIVGDRVRLNLLFTNLISNGLKFNRSPRPRVELEWSDLGGYWEFTVSDNGIGIDPRYHDHIFDLFFRLNSKDEFDGTGTGLNLCRRIVEEHRGTIRLESEAGRGCRFIVQLPKDPALLTSPGLLP